MAQRQIDGLFLAVIQDGRIEARAASAQLARGGAPVTADTLFQAGSISKPGRGDGGAEARRARHAHRSTRM